VVRAILNFLKLVTSNRISLVGSSITTASAVTFSGLLFVELIVGFERNPYIGMISFVGIPAIFVLGLLLIPIGIFRQRYLEKKGAPTVSLGNRGVQEFLFVFSILTFVNVSVLGVATYKGMHTMESVAFCGTTCHTVMQPEYTAYLRSSHARVKCVECHIGEGASWFVRSKLSGSWQVIATLFDLYPKPIESPIHNLRPARETCEQCHWPEKFVGDKMKVIPHFKDDEKNTETKTVLLMRVGGADGGKSHGIHWHVDRNTKVRYLSDAKRENIYEVELVRKDGSTDRFAVENAPKDPKAKWREMDCVDCHNRPTHVFRTPSQEIDLALQSGAISRELPFIRREGLRVLKEKYASHEEAREKIREDVATFYAKNYPDVSTAKKDAIESASNQLGAIYASEVFPAMNVTWGTYPNRIGHEDYPGCQRCHDGDHKNAEGKAITDDCEACHMVLAQEEENPKILTELKP
jgi:hypothetical protein